MLARLQGVGLRFEGGTQALAGLSLTLQAGERLALLGPSGCGKSSVLRLLAGLLATSEGRVEVASERRALVFQQATLMPWASVLDNVALPLRLAGRPQAEAQAAASAQLAAVGLQGFERALPHELSGGMAMRAALARALVTAPELLLLDEPFGALDEISREQLGRQLLTLHAASPGMGLLLVTHSVFEAVALADRMLVMSARPGRVVAEIAVAAQRAAAGSADWAQQDAYFQLVRQAQLALAAGVSA
jgi:NitT/TauT family transport system ATP-binding protein